MENFKRKISFLDANNERTLVEIEIKNGKFSMMFERANSMGQSGFSPKNKPQQDLWNLWDKYHNNDMKAGTPKQEEILKRVYWQKDISYSRLALDEINSFSDRKFKIFYAADLKRKILLPEKNTDKKARNYFRSLDLSVTDEDKLVFKYSYDLELFILFMNGMLYDKDYFPEENGGLGYKYGTKWLKEELPENIAEITDQICNKVEFEEDKNVNYYIDHDLNVYSDKKRKFKVEIDPNEFEDTDFDIDNIESFFESFNEPEKAIAIAIMFDISLKDIDDLIEEPTKGNIWKIEGFEYLFGTDDEMDDEWDEYLENYLDECVLSELSEIAKRYFDEEAWKSDAKTDGRGHSLNRYDGGELSITINDEIYYAYRQ